VGIVRELKVMRGEVGVYRGGGERKGAEVSGRCMGKLGRRGGGDAEKGEEMRGGVRVRGNGREEWEGCGSGQ